MKELYYIKSSYGRCEDPTHTVGRVKVKELENEISKFENDQEGYWDNCTEGIITQIISAIDWSDLRETVEMINGETTSMDHEEYSITIGLDKAEIMVEHFELNTEEW